MSQKIIYGRIIIENVRRGDKLMISDLCDICSGELQEKEIDYEVKIGNEFIIIKQVKADVCSQCNEVYLDAETSEKIDYICTERRFLKPLKYIPVPVFSFPKRRKIA